MGKPTERATGGSHFHKPAYHDSWKWAIIGRRVTLSFIRYSLGMLTYGSAIRCCLRFQVPESMYVGPHWVPT